MHIGHIATSCSTTWIARMIAAPPGTRSARREDLMALTMGIVAFKNEEAGSDYGPLMAGATLIVAPLVVAFLAAQRWFIEGLSAGAVK